MDGRAGFFVLTPLGSIRASLWACRGFGSAGMGVCNQNDRQSLKPVMTEPDRVEIHGNLLPRCLKSMPWGKSRHCIQGVASPLLRQT